MRKRLVVIISVALTSFLIGTIFSTNYLASGAKPPSVWDAIYELQAQVNRLNNTVIEQQTQITELQSELGSLNSSLTGLQSIVENLDARMPGTVTAYSEYLALEADHLWHDIITVTLTLDRTASVLAIATTNVYGIPDIGMHFRQTLNGYVSETRREGPTSNGNIIELTQLWLDLSAGPYTFTFQCEVDRIGGTSEFGSSRLTLVIIY